MFDYTQGALNKVLDDFKKLARAVNIGLQVFSMLYLIYALVAGTGFFVANLLLLVLTAGYFVFFLIMEFTDGKKTTKKRVKTIYRWSKRAIKLSTILLTAYALVTVTKEFTPLSLILLLLMILGFVLDLLFEIIIRFLTAECELIVAGVKRDFEELKKPVQSVGNFFKKLTGREVEQAPPLTKKEQKTQDILEAQTAEIKRRRNEKKEQRRLEKQAKKRAKKDVQQIPAPVEESLETP